MGNELEIEALASHAVLRARIAELVAERNDPDFPPKHARRLIAELRAELAAIRAVNVDLQLHFDTLMADYKAIKAQEPRPIGYINKKDLARLQDETAWDGSYLSIGVDHFAQWLEDEPYEHLAAIYAAPVVSA